MTEALQYTVGHCGGERARERVAIATARLFWQRVLVSGWTASPSVGRRALHLKVSFRPVGVVTVVIKSAADAALSAAASSADASKDTRQASGFFRNASLDYL